MKQNEQHFSPPTDVGIRESDDTTEQCFIQPCFNVRGLVRFVKKSLVLPDLLGT